MFTVSKLWSTLTNRFTEIFILMSVWHVLKKFISQWKYLAAIWTILQIMYWFVQLEILLGREPLIALSAWVWSVMHTVNMSCQKVLLGEASLAQMALIYYCSADIKLNFGRMPLTTQTAN